MSIQSEARAFMAANDQSPVVEGWAHNADNGGGQGGVYVLDDGRRFDLSSDVCRALPEGYPKWKEP